MAMETARPTRTKLSKHLLEMKFMKRTALRIETDAHKVEQQQHIDDEHWALDVPDLKQKESMYIMEPSHSWCESLKWGRMAFKGFNPEIEKLMHGMGTEQELELSEEREIENSVSDVEMAKRYSSLVGTIGNKFSRKRKRKQESSSDDSSEEEETSPADKERLEMIMEDVGTKLAELRSEHDTSQEHVQDILDSPKKEQASPSQTKVPIVAQTSSSQQAIDLAKRSPETKGQTTKTKINVKAKSNVLNYYNKKNKGKSKPEFMKPKDD